MQQMRAWLTPLDENKKFNFLEYEDSIIIPEMYGYETIEWASSTRRQRLPKPIPVKPHV